MTDPPQVVEGDSVVISTDPPPIPDFPNANLGDSFSDGVDVDGPLNEEMQAALDKHSAQMEKQLNQEPATRAGAENHACFEMSQFDTSSLSMTCEACGHYSSMCLPGKPCQLCILQAQIDVLTAAAQG